MQNARSFPAAVLALFALCGSGCATLPADKTFGAGATVRPGWARLREAAGDAVRDPRVWVPVIGAAVFQVGDLDRHTSDSARDQTPVFGSQRNADRWSNDLETASLGLAVVTLLAANSGETGERWTNKLKGGMVELGAFVAASSVTATLKGATGRERPDGSDHHSFPSGHANATGIGARLAQYNLEYIPLVPSVRKTLDVGLDVMEIGVSWARVEAGKHFPSDTLAGLAVGNFCAAFFTRAFLDSGGHQQLALQPADGGAILRWQWTR
jgi:hypothetical protein